jgi:uncharacterized membrane protein
MAQVPPTPPTQQELDALLAEAQWQCSQLRALVLTHGDEEAANALLAALAAINAVLAAHGLPPIEI